MPSFIKTIIILFLGIFLYSCEKLSTDNQIPAYIYIKDIELEANSVYGENTHSISDVWVYVNDKKIGAFEIPAKIPILNEGNVKLSISPGIRLNGVYDTRAVYTFYTPYTVNLNLIKGNLDTIKPIFTFDENAKYEWIENFESGGISFDKSTKSTAFIEKDIDLKRSENYSGRITLNDTDNICEIYNFQNIEMPQYNSHVFLEMDFLSEFVEIEVGVISNESSGSIQHSVFVLKTTSEWKKIYINLTPV